MADKKISALTGATTPLAGTEVLPIVQGGSTVKVSIDNVTKGRTVNASVFDTDVAAAGVTLSGVTLSADGTDANIDINVTPKGSGALKTTNLTTSGNTTLGDAAADTLDVAGGAIVKDASGRVGINVTPSNWASRAAGYDVLQIGVTSLTNIANVYAELSYNQFIESGTGTRKYISANPALFNRVGNTGYSWHTAPAGSAGAAITFTQVMELSAAGNLTVNTGNLVVGTAGKGIDFSANGGDVLKQYDEGTWVPTITAGSGSITSYTSAGKFTRIGRQVTLTCSITVTDNGTGSGYIVVGNLPFSADASVYAAYGHNNTVGGSVSGATAGTLIYLNKYDGSYPVATGQTLLLTSIYFV